MAFLFRPPTGDLPRNYVADNDRVFPVTPLAKRLYRYINRGPVGRSVLKDGAGNYRVVESPTNDEVKSAAAVYIGGHEYYVSQAEMMSLTQAGYTVEVV